jgi:chromosome partitioning protein
MAERIVISNRKGGTGKTTVSVNLAAEMAAKGYNVVILDLDTQSHCADGLGVHPDGKYVHDVFKTPKTPLNNCLYQSHHDNLWLCPADPNYIHSQTPSGDKQLDQAIHAAGFDERFDLIVIDTPPSLDALLINALNAGTSVIVPFIPHFLSYQGIKQLVKLIHKVKINDNPCLTLGGFLPTMANQTWRHHKQVIKDVELHFGKARLLPAIRSDIKLADAFLSGQPIRVFAPKSRAAEDFKALGCYLAPHYPPSATHNL